MTLKTEDLDYASLPDLEAVTRDLVGPTELSMREIEDSVFGWPRFRRHTAPRLANAYFAIAKRLKTKDLFEIGVMDGRHTKEMLRLDDRWRVHSFEPNLYCYASLVPLLDNPRLSLVSAAVSDSCGFAQFFIPRRFGGKDLPAMSGVSSLHSLNDEDAQKTSRMALVPLITGERYFHERKEEVDPASCALWIDTEGNAVSVLKGFASRLSEVPLAIVETEYGELFSSSPNFNEVMDLARAAGMKPIARDWPNIGQCNVLLINPSLVAPEVVAEGLAPYQSFVREFDLEPRA